MTTDPPLRPLHPDASLSPAKLTNYDRLATQELIDSLRPGGAESLRVRPDGTILNGHNRVSILRGRSVDVDRLLREVIAREDSSGAARD